MAHDFRTNAYLQYVPKDEAPAVRARWDAAAEFMTKAELAEAEGRDAARDELLASSYAAIQALRDMGHQVGYRVRLLNPHRRRRRGHGRRESKLTAG